MAKLILDQSRHEEIHKLLIRRPQVTMRVNLPCYSISVLQNAAFFGRQEELNFCKTAIAPKSHSKGVLLYGTGGVGKTSIALELVYQEKSRRNIITWVAAEDESKIAEGFVRIASDLGLHEEGANAKSDRDAVKTWLEKTCKFCHRNLALITAKAKRSLTYDSRLMAHSIRQRRESE